MKFKIKKKGVDPVITKILLIALVIAMAIIIFLWFRGMNEEAVTKFGGLNIQLVCNDIKFEASYSEGMLYMLNTGNVPIYRINLKISGEGGYTTITPIPQDSNWPETGLNQGENFQYDISSHLNGADEIIMIPVLIGNSGTKKKMHECDERNGHTLNLN